MEKNLQKFKNIDSTNKNIQILTMIINNNIYNFNDFNLNNILLPFLVHNKKQNYYNPKQNAFIFPEAIDIDSLKLFCTFLLTPEKVDMTKYSNLKKIINVSVFFNAIEIINNIIQKNILSNLNKNNCLDIIIYLLDFIYTENDVIKNIFHNLIEKALVQISQNLIYFLNNKHAELYSLNSEILEEIIKLFFKENDNKKILNDDIKNVFELLINSRGISNDIFLLLENERKKAINNFESLFNKNKLKLEPSLIWKINYDDIKKHNYQEKKISLDNIDILLISYYDNINDSFQLAIQILNFNNIKTDKSKNDDLLNTSTAKKIINKNNFFLSEEIQLHKEKENILINILSLCEISEIKYKSHINFNGIYIKNNSRFLICKIDNFIKKFKNKKNSNSLEFSLKIYFSRNYIFPKIIEYICQNFDKYYNLPSINKIPRSAMNILLKNDNMIFIPNYEVYKLYSIENWINFKKGYISKKYIDIFKNIDWKKIDNDKLIEFFMKNAKIISKDESLKNDLFFEIQRRFQEEYSSYYLNNKTFINNSKSISISNYEDFHDKSNYLSFTFDFLSKILSYLITTSKNDCELAECPINHDKSKDIIYSFPEQEEKEIKFPITQRNNIPKMKTSNNTVIKGSPLSNDYKIKYKSEIANKINNKINNKNQKINICVNQKKSNNNIPTNRYEKKSSNNSLSSYQINLSGFSAMEYLNSDNGNISIFNHKNKKIQGVGEISINPKVNLNKGIKSFTPNNSKERFIVKNKDIFNERKYKKKINSKPSRIQYKKNHSKSVDRFFSLNEIKNIKNNPIESSETKIGLFPNYIKKIQNDKNSNNKNSNQNYKRYHIKNNLSAKIPVQFYNDEIKNNRNNKISSIIYKNDAFLSNEKKMKSKYKNMIINNKISNNQ